MDATELDASIDALLQVLTPAQVAELVEELPADQAAVLLTQVETHTDTLAASPLEQAARIIPTFVERPHLAYLSERITQAVKDVEAGQDRRIIVEMPPRSGKSLLATEIAPTWILSTHPDWPILLTSYSGTLATSWGRQIRRWIAEGRVGSHLQIADDAGAAADWETVEGGAIRSRSIREPLTGFGAKVLIVDDPVKDHISAHSKTVRDEVWNWFQSVAVTRLHPPSLVIVVMTRWHEDDLVGRLLNPAIEGGDPDSWEVIRFPAIATKEDVLGRTEGQPLYSPLITETEEQAVTRWAAVKRAVGSYAWSALYQQQPSPAEGAIFSTGWWRYWTTDPDLVDPDSDNVILVDPAIFATGRWLDSWDFTFDKTEKADYVVGQRWVKVDANRYLIGQQRDRMDINDMLAAMRRWATANPDESPYGEHVRTRLIEKKASGAAIITMLRNKISGIKPINPTTSKEARARSVTPEIESGNVLLPHPGMPGFEWVRDLVAEFREFPNGAHDDQVDAASQALMEFAEVGVARVQSPARRQGAQVGGSRVGAMRTVRRR